jgi:hypothetical protein
MHQLTKSYEFERVAPDSGSASTYTLAAGTTDVNSSAIDLAGCYGATFQIMLGAIVATGTLSINIEHSDASGSGFAAISGLTVAVDADTDDNKILVADLAEPTKRYVRLAIDRGTANTTIDGIVVIKAKRGNPVTQGATVEMTDI